MRGTVSQVAAFAGKSERTIQRWMAGGQLPYKRLPGGLIEVDDALLFEPESGTLGAILEALQRIEEKLDTLAARGDTVSQSVRHERARPVQKDTDVTQDELPEGLTPWRDYARAKGYSETTIGRAIGRGDVPIHTGRWKRGKGIIQEAIDEEGKAAIDRLYEK